MKEPESYFYYQGKANRIWSLPFLEIPGILGDSKHIVTGRGVVGMMFLALASLHLINALDCPERLPIIVVEILGERVRVADFNPYCADVIEEKMKCAGY